MRFNLVVILAAAALLNGCTQGDSRESKAWRRDKARKQLNKATGRDEKTQTLANGETAGGESVPGGPATRPAAVKPPLPRGGRRMLVIEDGTLTVDDILGPIRPRLEFAAANKTQAEYYKLLTEEVRDQIIREVAESLVWKEANRDLDEQRGKAIDDAVFRMERDRINREFDGRLARYEASLAALGMSREQARQKMRRTMIVREYVRQRIRPQASVSREDVRRYYDEHYSEFNTPGKLEMWHIDIPLAAVLPPEQLVDKNKLEMARKIARERMNAAHAKLSRGEPFEKVCKEYSRSRDVDQGGRFGVVTAPLAGYWEAPSRRFLTMRGGETTPVFESEFGVFILRAVQVSPGKSTSFESAQLECHEKAREKRMRELEGKYLQALADKAGLGDMQPFVEAVISAAPEWRGGSTAAGGRG